LPNVTLKATSIIEVFVILTYILTLMGRVGKPFLTWRVRIGERA
jgi:hypothetical protein